MFNKEHILEIMQQLGKRRNETKYMFAHVDTGYMIERIIEDYDCELVSAKPNGEEWELVFTSVYSDDIAKCLEAINTRLEINEYLKRCWEVECE